jgi:hypothetical protein
MFAEAIKNGITRAGGVANLKPDASFYHYISDTVRIVVQVTKTGQTVRLYNAFVQEWVPGLGWQPVAP